MAARRSVEIERWILLDENHVKWYALELVVLELGILPVATELAGCLVSLRRRI
jgi:hypothetical protein